MKLGARRYVLTNVGPLGCIPYRMTMQGTSKGCCVQEDNELVSGFNAALKLLVDELNGVHPTAKFVVANSYNVVMQIIKNPAAYGRWRVIFLCQYLLEVCLSLVSRREMILDCYNRDHFMCRFCHEGPSVLRNADWIVPWVNSMLPWSAVLQEQEEPSVLGPVPYH